MYVCIAGAFLVCLSVTVRETPKSKMNQKTCKVDLPSSLPPPPSFSHFDLGSAFVGLNLLLYELQITHHTAHN